MLTAGKAIKVCIYISEGSNNHGMARSSSILDFLFFRRVSGATVIKGVAGFGADHHLHTAGLVAVSDHLPLKIEFIETQEKVNELLPKLQEMVGSGVIEIQETTIAKAAGSSEKKKDAIPVEHTKISGKARRMRVYLDENDKWKDKPLYEALLSAMRANDLAGATVERAVMGFGADHEIHKHRVFQISRDSALMITVVDTAEKLDEFMPVLDSMLGEAIVTFLDVDILKYAAGTAQTDAAAQGKE